MKAPEERNINRTIPSRNTIIKLGIICVNDYLIGVYFHWNSVNYICNGNPFRAILPKKIVGESVAQRETPK